ncbi:bacterial sensory transduction regulator family protein [Lyngbya aestuarii BL J]|uniref:Bacterial sensory transduction regulator family protein n=1 Tax=Lyngbya aestuarii BL J TaxID=1348334 RepID=U7QAC4_9CYAN|nr:YbjN domain-containing protein [Lyngbya aestuarii]ERT04778.1 bacterial sensory transduction regulator family protein [Lyngbya aestuarii BL J]
MMSDLDLNEATSHPLAKYRNHLEFYGYRIEEIEDRLYCRHSRKSNLILNAISDRGVLISIVYSFEPDFERLDMLEYVNELNLYFTFMKAYLDEDGDLILETFFEGEYDRTNFSILLDNIEYDTEILLENELTQEYLK